MKKKPQKGNPHELTVKQHCFPRRSIERFVNDDGIVHVWLIEQGKSIRVLPKDQLFCARWVWDQRAEAGFMREVEDAYQELADGIEEGRIVRRLRVDENRVVTEMYSLWRARSKWRRTPLPDEPLKDVIRTGARILKGRKGAVGAGWRERDRSGPEAGRAAHRERRNAASTSLG